MAEIAEGDPAAAYLRGLREQFDRARPAGDQPPLGVTEAERIQEQLRQYVEPASRLAAQPTLVAGVDVSYDKASEQVVAAAVLIDPATGELRESVVVHGAAAFPYVPGLLGFREVPILIEALAGLAGRPDVVVCDGYGLAHPRRFGLACHLGVVTGLPTFGVAKTPFVAGYTTPGRRRGEWSPLCDGDEVLGRVLRTQTDVKPVFVSVGHRISLDEATEITLGLCHRYRLPETTRAADHLSRKVLRCLATSAEGSRDDLARPRPKIHRSVEARINPSSDDTVDVAGAVRP